MTYAAMAMQGVGTAMSVFGALHKGESDAWNVKAEAEAKARTAEAQAEADTFNSKVYVQLAKSEKDRSTADAIDYRRKGSEVLAQLRAKQAASGLALSGSPLMVDENVFKEIQFSTDRIAYAGRLAELRMLNQSELLNLSAERNKATAKFARETGAISSENVRTSSIINAISGGVSGMNNMFKTTIATQGAAAGSAGKAATPFYIPTGTGWF